MPAQTSPPVARRVVLTGAAGRIGRAVSERLADRWDLVRTDREADASGVGALDVTDLDACRVAFTDADAVVHLAANPSPDATFSELLGPNLVGPYAVAQAAADAGVRRLVLASSLHAVSALPQAVQRRTGDQPRPGNLYGATKAWSEAVGARTAAVDGFVVAHGVSANRHSVADLEDTRRALGYAPVDDAWADR